MRPCFLSFFGHFHLLPHEVLAYCWRGDTISHDIDIEEDEVEEDAQEEEDDEPPIPVNSRGRPIIRPTKDGAPISEGETYRRKNWRN